MSDSRREMVHAMESEPIAVHKTPAGVECSVHVSPVYLTDDNSSWRIALNRAFPSGRFEAQVFDVETARAYHLLLGEFLRKYDSGEVRNPWEKK